MKGAQPLRETPYNQALPRGDGETTASTFPEARGAVACQNANARSSGATSCSPFAALRMPLAASTDKQGSEVELPITVYRNHRHIRDQLTSNPANADVSRTTSSPCVYKSISVAACPENVRRHRDLPVVDVQTRRWNVDQLGPGLRIGEVRITAVETLAARTATQRRKFVTRDTYRAMT